MIKVHECHKTFELLGIPRDLQMDIHPGPGTALMWSYPLLNYCSYSSYYAPWIGRLESAPMLRERHVPGREKTDASHRFGASAFPACLHAPTCCTTSPACGSRRGLLDRLHGPPPLLAPLLFGGPLSSRIHVQLLIVLEAV